MVAVLALCAALMLYHHAAYPLLLRVFGRWFGDRHSTTSRADTETLPTVGLLVPAHNEEKSITQKVRNCAELEYAPGKLSVTVVLDGCEDATERLARKEANENPNVELNLICFDRNIGKVAVLNRVIPELQADLVALSDVSAVLKPDALTRAAAHFSDPGVGVVCGTYIMPDDASPGERAYWDYQVRIKSDEAAVSAPMGAHGAFYVFRRKLFTPLDRDTINDDFVLPMRMVDGGWRAIYDQTVVATELEATANKQDFRRRVRIGAGNLQQTLLLRNLANPARPRLAFVFISGKALRSVMPFVLLALFIASVWLAIFTAPIWRKLVALELAGGVMAAAGALFPARSPKMLTSFSYWLQGYLASGIGAVLLLTGHARAAWQVSNWSRGHRPVGSRLKPKG
ncbi:glycosyltransferase family 2 protein [Mesorhizobium sp. BAC0120]|uniref:glycosyltransferase family 2 protein n=1 Tax=Mesorhizobium sp. BAC0120 TaxID=3090670 RepID=UPI00298D3DAC|nr:glycosyltransferase family 2 protein [Mesorhizobium sp. BAC0120]MDW6023078.1 glycosyltransferase family 2 protein [Mesorhizobium sp. BAC0120]